MKKLQNAGTADRTIRVALGLLLLFVSFSHLAGKTEALGIVSGAVLLITGAAGFCPIYTLLKINTCKS